MTGKATKLMHHMMYAVTIIEDRLEGSNIDKSVHEALRAVQWKERLASIIR